MTTWRDDPEVDLEDSWDDEDASDDDVDDDPTLLFEILCLLCPFSST